MKMRSLTTQVCGVSAQGNLAKKENQWEEIQNFILKLGRWMVL